MNVLANIKSDDLYIREGLWFEGCGDGNIKTLLNHHLIGRLAEAWPKHAQHRHERVLKMACFLPAITHTFYRQ